MYELINKDHYYTFPNVCQISSKLKDFEKFWEHFAKFQTFFFRFSSIFSRIYGPLTNFSRFWTTRIQLPYLLPTMV